LVTKHVVIEFIFGGHASKGHPSENENFLVS
jgi:hypothetical protein